MTVPYSALTIANTFVHRFGRSGGIEHMKLQKLVYRAYGWWLAARGVDESRLTTEGPEIWRYGPVFADLYPALKVFSDRPITEPQSMNPFENPPIVGDEDPVVREFIGWVWGRYGHLSAFALSDMAHKDGTPWHRMAVENDFSVPRHTKIRDEYIHEEFAALMNSQPTIEKREAAHAE